MIGLALLLCLFLIFALGELPVGEWRSLVAHLVWDQRVAGSNPVSPTIISATNKSLFLLKKIDHF
jgi:hypothetical protein